VDSLTGFELASLGVLVLLSALLTGAEAAYFSLGRTRLKRLAEEQGPERGPFVPLLTRPHELLVTLLVGITLVNIAASALAATMAAKLFGPAGLAVAIGAMTVLLVVFGEVLPMTLAVEHPELTEVLAKLAEGIAVEGMESLIPALIGGQEMQLLAQEGKDLGGRSRHVQAEHVRPRHHDLAHQRVLELEDLVDHLPLGAVHHALAGPHVHKRAQLGLRDLGFALLQRRSDGAQRHGGEPVQ